MSAADSADVVLNSDSAAADSPAADSLVPDRVVAEVLLSLVPGVGPRIRKTLLAHFGSAEAVLAAAPSELREAPGIGAKLSRAISAARREIDVAAELALCRERNVSVIVESDEGYPSRLKEIPDPPGVLFVRGNIVPADGLAVAIVGTRHATHYGLAQTERLASGLARAGYTIISGLARGIDAAAHRGALKAGGRTLAVLGSGVLNVYPPEHMELAAEICLHGAVISENPPLAPPLAGAFPQRNRIVTGLSLGVLVVEAADRSGALISARHATEQGREVFAVPGRIDSRMSRGCHKLIRDGAKLVESVDDILEELGPLASPTPREDGREVRHPAELQLNQPEQAVLDAVTDEPTSIDDLVVASGLAVHNVLSTISVLEMKRLIKRVSGNRVIRAFRPEP
jgi:DNA processing protein